MSVCKRVCMYVWISQKQLFRSTTKNNSVWDIVKIPLKNTWGIRFIMMIKWLHVECVTLIMSTLKSEYYYSDLYISLYCGSLCKSSNTYTHYSSISAFYGHDTTCTIAGRLSVIGPVINNWSLVFNFYIASYMKQFIINISSSFP